MSNNFIPHICGDPKIEVPDRECTDCEKLEKRVTDLEDTRLVQSDIQAGDNIIIIHHEDSNLITISATAATRFEKVVELPETGETNVIYLVPDGDVYDQWIWTEEDGWIQTGDTSITIDKQTLMTALGYRETTLSMTDMSDNTVSQTILVEDTI